MSARSPSAWPPAWPNNLPCRTPRSTARALSLTSATRPRQIAEARYTSGLSSSSAPPASHRPAASATTRVPGASQFTSVRSSTAAPSITSSSGAMATSRRNSAALPRYMVTASAGFRTARARKISASFPAPCVPRTIGARARHIRRREHGFQRGRNQHHRARAAFQPERSLPRPLPSNPRTGFSSRGMARASFSAKTIVHGLPQALEFGARTLQLPAQLGQSPLPAGWTRHPPGNLSGFARSPAGCRAISAISASQRRPSFSRVRSRAAPAPSPDPPCACDAGGRSSSACARNAWHSACFAAIRSLNSRSRRCHSAGPGAGAPSSARSLFDCSRRAASAC